MDIKSEAGCSGDTAGLASAAPTKSSVANEALAEVLDRHTTVGSLWRAEGERIRCVACGHRCLIAAGRRGICKVRFNEGGRLRVPFGYVAGVQCDPVEKKPFYHVYPGSDALTFGMMGCDFHCGYCQNWVTSQALRDAASETPIRSVRPEQLVQKGKRLGARLMVSSYNEPLITAEWAVAVFQEAKAAGLACAFVSNGNATAEALDFLRPWIVAYKIDLKSFDPKRYRELGGVLEHVIEGVRMVHERGLWLEIVTLLVPGFNDGEEEMREMARFISSVSADIPWHVTAFHPEYKMTTQGRTASARLVRVAEIGAEEGLRFVYAGNAPGQVGSWENTWCPKCRQLLIARRGFLVTEYHLSAAGQCPRCQTAIPGIWPENPAEVQTGEGAAAYWARQPRGVDLPKA